jgi:hypothetical protein
MNLSSREGIVFNRLLLHGDAVAWGTGSGVSSVVHDNGVQEVFVKMVNIFKNTTFGGARDADVINEGKMLDIFAETNTTSVRANGNIELLGHQKNGKNFIDTGNTARVDLAEIDGFSLEELLEDDSVLNVFTSGNTSARIQSLADSSMTEDIIGRSGLLNEERVERKKILHPINSLLHIPNLVGVHHQYTIRANFLTEKSCTSNIGSLVRTDLLLEDSETFCLGFSDQTADFVI